MLREEVIKTLFKECSELITEQTQEIHHLILGSGCYNAKIIFLNDAPGAIEEETRTSIAGKTLEKFQEILDIVGLPRENIYVTNLVKYRPYRVNVKTGRIVNRSLRKEEMTFFKPYLEKEIDTIGPKVIVTLGRNVLHALLGEDVELDDVHGVVRKIKILEQEYTLLPLYHPLAMVYENIEKHDDMYSLKQVVDQVGREPDNVVIEEAETEEVKVEEAVVTEDETVEAEEAAVTEDEAVEAEEAAVTEDEAVEAEEVAVTEVEVVRTVEATTTEQEVVVTDSEHEEVEKVVADTPRKKEEKFIRTKSLTTTFKIDSKMKVLVVYGGTSKVDDPTYEVVERVSSVFKELDASIIRLDLNNKQVDMNHFFDELEHANAVVLATTVEWYGIGGLMQQFLDECWRYSNKSNFENVFLMNIVISIQGNERDAELQLIKSWELLGGLEGVNICGCMSSADVLETNFDLWQTIEKKAEAFYRLTLSNKVALPTSIRENRKLVEVPQVVEVTQYHNPTMEFEAKQDVSGIKNITNYDEFIEKQQKDIKDISKLFKMKLEQKTEEYTKTEVEIIQEKFVENKDRVLGKVQWRVEDNRSKDLVLDISHYNVRVYYGNVSNEDLLLISDVLTMEKILEGKMTLQRAFMTGSLKAKGDFSVIYKLDAMFNFG